MAKLTVSVAGVDYDRTRAIFDGTVGIEGCETICVAMSPEEAFHRAFRYQEFDITELSLSNTMNLVAIATLLLDLRGRLHQAGSAIGDVFQMPMTQ